MYNLVFVLIKKLEKKSEWVRKETIKIYKVTSDVRLSSSSSTLWQLWIYFSIKLSSIEFELLEFFVSVKSLPGATRERSS